MDNNIFPNNTQEEEKNEKKMRKKAKRRVNMRVHFMIFLLVNLVFWLLYIFLFKDSSLSDSVFHFCLGLTSIWLIVVYAHYLIVFRWGNRSVEKELEKLRKQEAEKLEINNTDNNIIENN